MDIMSVVYFDQRLECAAPKRWLKYTTYVYLESKDNFTDSKVLNTGKMDDVNTLATPKQSIIVLTKLYVSSYLTSRYHKFSNSIRIIVLTNNLRQRR